MSAIEEFFSGEITWLHLVVVYVLGFYTYRPVRRFLINTLYFLYFNVLLGLLGLATGNTESDSADPEHSTEFTPRAAIRDASAPKNAKADSIKNHIAVLQKRLDKLYANISHFNLDQCKTELEKCKAMMQNIRDLMTYQRVNFSDVFSEIQSVREKIVDIDFAIARKDNVWWRKLKRLLWAILDLAKIKLLGPGI